MNITIVGAGNSGCAHAFKFSELGHDVCLLKTSHSLHDQNFDEIVKNNGIWCIDDTQDGKRSFQKLKLATRDVGKAFRGAEIVFVLTQSLQHESVSYLISPYLNGVKALAIIPGGMGSLYFRNKLSKEVIIAEGESTPFDARIVEPGLVNILFKNVRNALSFLPASDTNRGILLFSRILETYKYTRNNVIETALHNPNLIVHTIGTIMSASRIEYSKGEYWMYKEGFTNSIWNLIEILDDEKKKVIQAYGGVPISYLECCKFRNEEDLDKNSLEVFMNYANFGSPKGPSSINNRYLIEDVPNGLCLLSSLAKIASVEVPLTESLITIASCLLKKEMRSEARTIEALGLSGLTIKQIIEYIS